MRLKKLTRIDSTRIQLLWSDGHQGPVRLDTLRNACPCASCQGETVLLHHYAPNPDRALGPEAFELKSAEVVGNYALRPVWGDGHDQGIYTWEHLRSLCGCDECSAGRSRGNAAGGRNA